LTSDCRRIQFRPKHIEEIAIMYDVMKSHDKVTFINKTGDGLIGITPDIAEINDMRRSGLVSDEAILEFVKLQNEIKKR